MKTVKQAIMLEINNLDDGSDCSLNISKHGSFILNRVRCNISGPSNSEKTYIAFNLLFYPNGLRFDNMYVF